MPIRPEMKARYPADWPEIRARIMARAGGQCEWCGVENGAVGYRAPGGEFVKLGGSPEDAGTACEAAAADGFRPFRIVLTCAHIHDHSPENCSDDNLAMLCQRCHNRHDGPMRRQGRRDRAALAAGQGDLLPPPP